MCSQALKPKASRKTGASRHMTFSDAIGTVYGLYKDFTRILLGLYSGYARMTYKDSSRGSIRITYKDFNRDWNGITYKDYMRFFTNIM